MIYFLLTPRCNLDCKYCFQRQDRSAYGKASIKIIDSFVQYCLKTCAHHVEFFGGEPLLYKDLFKYAVESLCNKIPDMEIGVVTNGTLIDEGIMEIFETRPVSILLSLDGEKSRHNSMRGGFERISKWFPRLVAQGRVTIAIQAGIIPGLCDNIHYIWGIGFKHVYINIIENYGWYTKGDVELFGEEYENALKGMLRGEGQLSCAMQLYRELKAPNYTQQCGITAQGLACDWQGFLYPCHRAPEIGAQFVIGDVYKGIDEGRMQKIRTSINQNANCSKSAKKYPLASFCPVTIYQRHKNFNGEWNPDFCKMINIKAKLVAKYYYEIDEYCKKNDPEVKEDQCGKLVDFAYLCS